MRTIKFAIIGYGGIAKTHALGAYGANIKLDLPFRIRLTHIVTRRPIEDMPPGVINVTNIEEVLKDPNIDFIDICTPNDSHLEITKLAARYGKAVYCEKPLASSYEEGMQMLEAAQKYKIPNGVAFNYRFIPAINLLKDAIENNIVGDIIDCKATLYHDSYLNPNRKGTWRTKAENGGGALLDLGVHLIDTINHTLGEIKEMQSDLQIFFKDRTEVDEIAKCDFTLESGLQGRFEVSRVHALHNHPTTIEVFGILGSIKVSTNNPYTIELYEYEQSRTITYGQEQKANMPIHYPAIRDSLGFFQDTHMASIIDFCNQLCGNPYVGATFQDGLKAQRLIDQAYNLK